VQDAERFDTGHAIRWTLGWGSLGTLGWIAYAHGGAVLSSGVFRAIGDLLRSAAQVVS
jgi:hypothetical protein